MNPGLDGSSSLMKHISGDGDAWRSGLESYDPESGIVKRKKSIAGPPRKWFRR